MKFSLSWLKDHLETNATAWEIADKLTSLGLEVESVTDHSKTLAAFTIAEITAAEQHPNADKLRYCTVNAGGGETLKIVCGAPNARAGLKTVLARIGTLIPTNGLEIKQAKIRGVESFGMLCSEEELGLPETIDGVIELASDAPVGEPFVKFAGLDDPVIEIAITPNRGDCLGVRGIARDLAASGMGTLKPLKIEKMPGSFESPVTLKLEDKNCPYFVGRYIRGVKNVPSPKWLQDKLRAIGQKPISALVDITNYFTNDLCRPMHVFDADKLQGGIVARTGKPGEKLLALNGKEYALDESVCTISDNSRAVAIGGIIGGEETGCSESTQNVFLEIAWFEPLSVARTGRKLSLNTDARHRFERSVDPAFLQDACEIATALITDICGGEVSNIVVAGAEPEWKRSIAFSADQNKKLTGLEASEAESSKILESLGFVVTKSVSSISVIPPSWRPDIEGAADLVEEITRIKGFDKIESLSLPISLSGDNGCAPGVSFDRALTARLTLAARGMTECITFSFLSHELATMFIHSGQQEADQFKLTNPISSDLDYMRPSIIPTLLETLRRNQARSIGNLALFETGPIFGDYFINQQCMAISGIRSEQAVPRNVHSQARNADTFDAKADAFAVISALGLDPAKLQTQAEAPKWMHPHRSGALKLGKNIIAYFGEVHPGILAELEIKGPVAAFEILADNLPQIAKSNKAKAAPTLSDLQAVSRDFAFLVDSAVTAEAILKAALSADKDYIKDAEIFDIFAGKGVADGKKSVALSVKLEPRDKTFTDEDIQKISEKIISAIVTKTGGELRG